MNEQPTPHSDLTLYERVRAVENELSRQIGKAVLMQRVAAELAESLMTIRDGVAALIKK